MVAPLDRASRLALVVACAALTGATTATVTDDKILVWKVGSPYTGETPNTKVPFTLEQEARSRGVRFSIEGFPARGFAAIFRDAVARNEAPDLLVFNNFGVMEGISTSLGTFEGIGEDATLRQEFIRVTGAFDALLGPERGWTYLVRLSANHQIVKTIALRAPTCPSGSAGSTPQADLMPIVPTIATAYLEADTAVLQRHTDPDRLPPRESNSGPVHVGTVQPCGVWGNDKLAFVSVNASSESESTIGHTAALLVLRHASSRWQLLAAARDPISNGAFLKVLPSVTAVLTGHQSAGASVTPATLLSPPTGDFPRPSTGQRFGSFTWSSSPSDDVVAEVIEFAYKDDARLFARPIHRGMRQQISAGELWTTRGVWNWRIWSITRAGELAFSETRTFVH